MNQATLDIQTVAAIEPSNGAVVVAFRSGLVAQLPEDHPDQAPMLCEAHDSCQQRRPFGVVVDGEGGLVELSHAHKMRVRSVREDVEDNSRLEIWFWAYSPVCYLTRDHPEFDRIRRTLEPAAASGGRVWLANRMHPVEGETEVWWKILDVHPLESLPPEA